MAPAISTGGRALSASRIWAWIRRCRSVISSLIKTSCIQFVAGGGRAKSLNLKIDEAR
jgi:hypothetical protein